MLISRTGTAGTLESSDVLVTVEPSDGGIAIDLEGASAARFGDEIRDVVNSTLRAFGVESVRVHLQDKGALDCTIRARLAAALYRAAGAPEGGAGAGTVSAAGGIDWEALS